MLASVAASAAAARALGYRGLAELIEQENLPPRAIARLFAMTSSRASRAGCSRDCVVMLLAGALGRYHTCPLGWDGEDEWQLALEALAEEPDPKGVLVKLSREANRILSEHWQEIASAA
jgi:alkylation response protein AidB-like acyl-CoA dehydrogenase